MSLVPLDYGSSDDDSDMDAQQNDKKASSPPPLTIPSTGKALATSCNGLFASLPAPKGTAADTKPSSSLSSSSLFSSLPPPKTQQQQQQSKPERKKVKIFVDLPTPEGPDEEKEHDRSQQQKSPPSSLFACLPAPKKTSAATAASSSGNVAKPTSAPMIPYTVGKKKAAQSKTTTTGSKVTSTKTQDPQPPQPSVDVAEDDEPEVDPDSFFTLSEPTFGRDVDVGPSAAPPPSDYHGEEAIGSSASAQYAYPSASAQYAYVSESAQYAYPPQQYAAHPNSYYAYPGAEYPQDSSASESTANNAQHLSDAAFRALGGSRELRDAGIELREVSQDSLVDSSWRLDPARASSHSASGGGIQAVHVSKGHKRKHNIMSLAADARARAEQINDMAANRMASKRDTRAKYDIPTIITRLLH
ncbi:hypothetical protein DFJ77DRAFT_547506 [Powellomyces hirtus]|nr:hypothetical protein DFJ77DRAFT_547506 [Powellomyces hirtus]